MIFSQLINAKYKVQPHFGIDSKIYVIHDCLIVNTLRMMGQYEQANKFFKIIKRQILTGEHPEFYTQFNLQ